MGERVVPKRSEVLNKIVMLIESGVNGLIEKVNSGEPLNGKESHFLFEAARSMSVVDRNMSEREKVSDHETRALTDEELDRTILEAAKQVETRRGPKKPPT